MAVAKKYTALNVIDYVSTRTGKYVRVEVGDVFSDMNSVGVRYELEHGNIREASTEEAEAAEEEGGEN